MTRPWTRPRWVYNQSTHQGGAAISKRFLVSSTVIVAALILALGIGREAHAATLTVVNTNDSGAGSLRQAIANAASGDTIDFNAGLSGQTITLTSGELLVSKDLTIAGPVGGITISGNNASRVFEISSGVTVNMFDLTVTGGNSVSQGGGGGIFNSGDALSLTNSTISGNGADFGGGIASGSGTLTLTKSSVRGNNSTGSGGGINQLLGTLSLTNSTVAGNIARDGGGIYEHVGRVTLTNSTVSRNSSQSGGGGIENDNGTLTLTNSTVDNNSALGFNGGGISSFGTVTLTNSTVSGNSASGFGGGISESLGTMTITNSTIDSNSAGGFGGGVYDHQATVPLTNSTVSRNSSQSGGGGITNDNGTLTLINSTVSDNSVRQGNGGGINSNGALTLANSTVSGNSAVGGGGILEILGTLTVANSIVANQTLGADCLGGVGGAIVSQGYNLDSDGTCNLVAAGDLPGTNPMLDPLALNSPGTTQTRSLRPGSPAIDHIPSGVNGCGTTISTDQRGVSRPQGSGCDIGAYELIPVSPTPSLPPVGGIVDLSVSGSGSSITRNADSVIALITLAVGAVLAIALPSWRAKRGRHVH